MRFLSVLLSISLSLPFSPSAAAQETAPKINLVIVEGEGAINNVRQRTARNPIVQVEDENHKPIAGAAVTFTLPMQGVGGSFADGSKILNVVTDAKGRAVMRTFKPNQLEGQFQIHVNASYQGQTAVATISQTNTAVAVAGAAAAAGISGKLIAIIAVGAAAIAGGVVAATRGGDSTQRVSVSPGQGSVGAPR